MALPWVRLENNWYSNPKFLMLVEDKGWRSIAVYLAGLAWAGAQGQDGYIPKAALPMIHGTVKEAHKLAEVALWIPAQGGWAINDWAEYQPSTEENERRSQKARDAARIRWHGKNGGGNASA